MALPVVPPRMALTPTEAARCVGVGRSFFYAEILPELRVVRRGRKTLVPITRARALDRPQSRPNDVIQQYPLATQTRRPRAGCSTDDVGDDIVGVGFSDDPTVLSERRQSHSTLGDQVA